MVALFAITPCQVQAQAVIYAADADPDSLTIVTVNPAKRAGLFVSKGSLMIDRGEIAVNGTLKNEKTHRAERRITPHRHHLFAHHQRAGGTYSLNRHGRQPPYRPDRTRPPAAHAFRQTRKLVQRQASPSRQGPRSGGDGRSAGEGWSRRSPGAPRAGALPSGFGIPQAPGATIRTHRNAWPPSFKLLGGRRRSRHGGAKGLVAVPCRF